MSSRFVRIAAGTLLSGAVFVGAGATPAFAAEGDDARDSNIPLQHNVNITNSQINISANIAIAANKGDGNANEGDGNTNKGDGNTNKCDDNSNKGDDNATKGDDNATAADDNANEADNNANEAVDTATAVAVQEQRNNSNTNQGNAKI